MNVVLFTGGRGSTVLAKQLVEESGIILTVVINGYDDGLSTGEIRNCLGDCLGPSDFRKNASRFASALRSCDPELINLLDLRLPQGLTAHQGLDILDSICNKSVAGKGHELEQKIDVFRDQINARDYDFMVTRLSLFINLLVDSKREFSYSDCSVGNLVFAGCFLGQGREFNHAITDYCALLGLPPGLIQNVTDGKNLFLVALDGYHKFLPKEADIVDARVQSRITDIYLLQKPLDQDQETHLGEMPEEGKIAWLEKHSVIPVPNLKVLDSLRQADLIVFAPGTQHSSLFPSYLTPGVGEAIASNLSATKLLMTNIHEDAEILDTDAVRIVRKAVHYLTEKGTRDFPVPSLITHYLFNYPENKDTSSGYVDLGDLEALGDPRPVRIGNYEDGITGYHDADKALTPFVEKILRKEKTLRIAVCLLDNDSPVKAAQSIVEILQHPLPGKEFELEIFYTSSVPLSDEFVDDLPYKIHYFHQHSDVVNDIVKDLSVQFFDYAVLFESSGMYHGDDIVKLISVLSRSNLDVVWGSRRLSVNDIHASYRLSYRKRIIPGVVSYIGSHILSLLYLLLYGRYISDTLSGLRLLSLPIVLSGELDFGNPNLNQHLLSMALRGRYEILEMPVRFLSQSPKTVRRTTTLQGLKAIGIIFWRKIKGPGP